LKQQTEKEKLMKGKKSYGIFSGKDCVLTPQTCRVRGSGQRRQTWEVGRILEAGHNLPKDLLFTVGHGRQWCHFGRSPEV